VRAAAGIKEPGIVIVAPPDRMEASLYPRLAAQLAARSTERVLLQSWTDPLPEIGTILLHRYGTDDISRGDMTLQEVMAAVSARISGNTRPRTILMDMPRGSETLTIASELGFAGAVDEHDCWVGMDPKLLQSGRGYESGMCGLRLALQQIGCEPTLTNRNYCMAKMGDQTNLAHLLVDYLAAYRKMA